MGAGAWRVNAQTHRLGRRDQEQRPRAPGEKIARRSALSSSGRDAKRLDGLFSIIARALDPIGTRRPTHAG